MALTPEQKKEVAEEARKVVRHNWPDLELHRGCLYLAWAACAVAHQRFGHKLVLMAGSSYWPRLDEKTDDGVSPNRFGYEFEESLLTFARAAQGLLPEMHVWAFDVETYEIVDLTAGYFPRQCQEMLGEDWRTDLPPDVFWDRPEKLPKLASYTPNAMAGRLAVAFLHKALGL